MTPLTVAHTAIRAARTAGGVAAWTAGAALGALTGIGKSDRGSAVERMVRWSSDWTAAVAGIEFRLLGAENAVSPRPAVFIFNHQSALDVVIVAKVLRSAVAPVAKKELRDTPVVGAILDFAGTAFLDRADAKSAIAALDPAIEKLRQGVSVVIAPEGTRSQTATVGPFKKGAFHLARAAGVPIVPIVIRNAGELFPKGSKTIHGGVVDVAVLDPIDVTAWPDDELGERIDELHQRYVGMLSSWPVV